MTYGAPWDTNIITQQRDTFWTPDGLPSLPACPLLVYLGHTLRLDNSPNIGVEKRNIVLPGYLQYLFWELIMGREYDVMLFVYSLLRTQWYILLQKIIPYQPSLPTDVHHLHHIWLVSHLSDWTQPLQSLSHKKTICDHSPCNSYLCLFLIDCWKSNCQF